MGELLSRAFWGGARVFRAALCLLLFVALGCGPCVSVRKDYEAHLRQGLTGVGLGDRVALTSHEHARLVFGAEAFSSASAVVLRERSSQGFSRVTTIPAAADTRGGAVTLDFELRLERVSTLSLLDPGSAQDVGVVVSLQTHARFEIPGQRSRWSWTSSVLLRAPLVIDPAQAQVAIALDDAELVGIEANFPWDHEAMPTSVSRGIERALHEGVEGWLGQVRSATVPVARVGALELPRARVPFQVLEVSVDEVSGAVAISLVSALRPALDNFSWYPLTRAGENEVVLAVPLPTLDAALRQQVLRPSGSLIVQDGDTYWQPLWEPDVRRPDRWAGVWRLWCLDSPNCGRRELPVTITSEVREGRLHAQVQASEAGDDLPPPEAAWETPASLQDLNRRTLDTMISRLVSWGRGASDGTGLALEPASSEISGQGLYVRFLAR